MEQDIKIETDGDEAALDAELNASIEAVKAGKELAQEVPIKTEGKVEDKPTTPTQEEDPSTSNPEDKEKSYEFRIPNKGKFESDEAYEKRVELLDLVKRRKLADTPEKKEELSSQIKVTKNQLKNLNGFDKINNPLNNEVDPSVDTEDPNWKNDRERLKSLGGVTKEEMAEYLRQERLAQEIKSSLETFVARHDKLKDDDTREVFFDFVDANYNWQGKSGKDLITVLELAKEAMFKESESIQERVIKGANVQEKINTMQFPGGTGGRQSFSPEMRKSIDEIKATGMSEEKAIALLSD